jgi:hypothetical protein
MQGKTAVPLNCMQAIFGAVAKLGGTLTGDLLVTSQRRFSIHG